MTPRWELPVFAASLAALVGLFLAESLVGGKVLSPADVLFVSASFADHGGPSYEPANRLLIDPVLQFQPWLEFNRAELRRGRLPLWNSHAGCGAPHLANGQSAVFDPFHLIAYLGPLPQAHAWMAALRLWTAGVGMFLLCRLWGFGAWGRWFSGLAWPFCGFLVLWLLFPVTSVAVWLTWLLWACERTAREPSARRIGILGLIVALVLLGGHVQTSAHVLLASALYIAWRCVLSVYSPTTTELGPPASRAGAAWAAGVALGVLAGAAAVLPLAGYLTRSPVWSDRAAAIPSVAQVAKPRVLDAVCTALPYAFGSQRRGQPNLARSLGVHNLNESAGGFAGLATFAWLAPWAFLSRRRQACVTFLAGLTAVGALAAFRVPPVDNLLRALPVVNVTDNRRLVLWVAFGLVTLGGIGLDSLSAWPTSATFRRWLLAWCGGASALLLGAVAVRGASPWLALHARNHYARAAAETPGADAQAYHARAQRQAQLASEFLPRYYALSAAQLIGLAALATALRRGRVPVDAARGGLLAMTLCDLAAFGFGLNPAIRPQDDRPLSPIITYLRREVGSSARVLSLGAELPPNTMMRYGLADARNYDSVELKRSLDWLDPLYEPGEHAHSSRRTITWDGIVRARDRLQTARVAAIVAPVPPPPGHFDRVDRVGDLWVARLPCEPLVMLESGQTDLSFTRDQVAIGAAVRADADDRLVIAETFDPGWKAEVDGQRASLVPYQGAFMAIPLARGRHDVRLRYDPAEVRWALALSGLGGVGIILAIFWRVPNCPEKKRVIDLDGAEPSGYNRIRYLHRTI